MNCKEARIHMMYALRVNSTNSKPDLDVDVVMQCWPPWNSAYGVLHGTWLSSSF